MTIVLPESYTAQMRSLLGCEAERFLNAYTAPRTQGLRFHTRKLSELGAEAREELLAALTEKLGLEPVPWCRSGYYYREDARPGKQPYHAAGLYYIQEPSAMSAVELLAPEPGDTVLDLAAAPGGKSTHILDKLHGRGLLISNEIHPVRARSLSENVERMGGTNAVVVNASPPQLESRFPRFFDKIMVDAPCSGEGMFRKDPDAIREWSPAHVEMCAARQLDILHSAVHMLKVGGTLAYSTCTFNEQENERTVEALLAAYPALELVRTERIWPHLHRGEGHFVAVLRLRGEADSEGLDAAEAGATHETIAVQQSLNATAGRHLLAAQEDRQSPVAAGRGRARKGAAAPKGRRGSKPEDDAMKLFAQFADTLGGESFTQRLFAMLGPGEPLLFGEQLYWLPAGEQGSLRSDSLHGLKVLRPGLHLAELKKDRAEPAHALALAMDAALAALAPAVELDPPQAERYLRGETLEAASSGSGWVLVTAGGFALGWGKQIGQQVKNHYPKGLRWH
ncbi:RsmB/NOP family class I SAM-dependent RNA methyltransferase [Paenibacillus sp. YYML68]|uniref:RsmB/NOP family class I SAM-dependent RNA methyltransferase n=1 Tax=Paenibacillus sp. YYML68 TaxID=2909250 RepID=UPI0024925EC5|nr:RsmB/NOP family class I SAM-dependent RNA methyltransferase [Paenibacillus sp. YYML68]